MCFSLRPLALDPVSCQTCEFWPACGFRVKVSLGTRDQRLALARARPAFFAEDPGVPEWSAFGLNVVKKMGPR